MKERLYKKVLYQDVNQYSVKPREKGSTGLRELVVDDRKFAIVIPNFLIRELIELQRETRYDIDEMIVSAIRQFIDREKSSEDHVWVDGVKYPIPKRVP